MANAEELNLHFLSNTRRACCSIARRWPTARKCARAINDAAMEHIRATVVDGEDTAFLMMRLANKLPDADQVLLFNEALKLMPGLKDLMERGVSKDKIDVRAAFDPDKAVGAVLCNHAGGGCDCGDAHMPRIDFEPEHYRPDARIGD